MNGLHVMSLAQKVNLYKDFDEARHEDLSNLVLEYESVKQKLATMEADLDDERISRRNWRQRAEVAEISVGRIKFAVVLIDGDGYHFHRSLYQSGDSGGAQAARALYTDVHNYIRSATADYQEDTEVVAMVYFNKQVPARALVNADIIQRASQFDEFIWSFTSSQSLFQAVDCGPGKERVDAKLRDLYRFYANNAQCKHIFLACCHDNGYVAELDKYRHDPVAAPKTILIKHGNIANQFYNLNFPFANFASTFDMQPLQAVRHSEPSAFVPKIARVPSVDSVSQGSESAPPQATTWSTVTANATRTSTRNNVGPLSNMDVAVPSHEPNKVSQTVPGDVKTGIPVNRHGDRIDRRLNVPSQAELQRFETRIIDQKLCNTEHLGATRCYAYNCKFDHEPIDAAMKNTLKYKARSIACANGSRCRKADCFYGHQCPWGNDQCSNLKCSFYRNGLHDIDDLEIVKFVPAMS